METARHQLVFLMGRAVAPCKLGLNATSGINPIDYLEWGARVKGNAEYIPNKHSNYVMSQNTPFPYYCGGGRSRWSSRGGGFGRRRRQKRSWRGCDGHPLNRSHVMKRRPRGESPKQECGHRPAGHHHLRRQGVGPPLRPCGAGRCAARMGTQTAHAHLHGIECLLAEASARC